DRARDRAKRERARAGRAAGRGERGARVPPGAHDGRRARGRVRATDGGAGRRRDAVDGGALSDDGDPLVIRSLEFLGPMATVDGWRPTSELPEVAFAGRSNVGKSSLLNRLVRRKAFARVSNT